MHATENGASDARKAILSIDGGGIRGAIPAVVLREIETRAKASISELFDVIAGTSTGGILALGLTCPGEQGGPRYDAAELLEMYQRDGHKIFPQRLLGEIRQLFGPKYPSRGRRRILEQRFGDARLSEALTEVIVTAYDIEDRKPVFFRTRDATDASEGRVPRDFPMSDVTMATSAAPTFFKPVKLRDPARQGKQMALVDGGVFANNPGMCGFVDRTTVKGQAGEALMVSLGTGRLEKPIAYSKARHWGLFGWGRHIINVVFDGVTESVEYELGRVLPDYHRLQTSLSHDEEPMDKAANVGSLVELAERLVAKETRQIDTIVAKLLARKSGSGATSAPPSPAPGRP